MPNGHMHFVGFALVQVAHKPENQEKAKAPRPGPAHRRLHRDGPGDAQRLPVDDVFVGLTGNWITLEYALGTGAVDVLAADMNCTPPTLGESPTSSGPSSRRSRRSSACRAERMNYAQATGKSWPRT